MELIKQNFLKLIKSQLIAGSMVLFVGNMLVNAISYLFHLLMGRMLGPADYGLLASLISFTYLLNIPLLAIGVVAVKYVSAWRGKNQKSLISYFYFWLNKWLTIFGVLVMVFLILLTGWLTSFLHLESNWQFWLMLLASFFGIYVAVNNAFLQAFLRFLQISIFGLIQIGAKLVIAVGLVWVGWQVMGPIWSYPISTVVVFIASTIYLYSVLGRNRKKPANFEKRSILSYGVPVLFSTLAFTSLYTSDVVLARHFLSAQESGYYAALANLGKVIYFAAYPITLVMFPMISEKHAKQQRFRPLFLASLTMVSLVCAAISVVYFLFPELMIRLLYGKDYLVAAPQLGMFAIFLSFYCLSFLVVNFYLSIKKTRVVAFPMVAALAQVILITIFHQGLSQTVLVSVVTTGLLFLGLISYNSNHIVRLIRPRLKV